MTFGEAVMTVFSSPREESIEEMPRPLYRLTKFGQEKLASKDLSELAVSDGTRRKLLNDRSHGEKFERSTANVVAELCNEQMDGDNGVFELVGADEISGPIQSLRKNIATLGSVDDAVTTWLASHLVLELGNAVGELCGPISHDSHGFFDRMTDQLGGREGSDGSRILAVCGKKPWNLARSYFERNFELARTIAERTRSSREIVHRIFIEPPKGFDHAEFELIKDHITAKDGSHRLGVAARIIPKRCHSDVGEVLGCDLLAHLIDKGTGFVVMDTHPDSGVYSSRRTVAFVHEKHGIRMSSFEVAHPFAIGGLISLFRALDGCAVDATAFLAENGSDSDGADGEEADGAIGAP